MARILADDDMRGAIEAALEDNDAMFYGTALTDDFDEDYEVGDEDYAELDGIIARANARF